MDRILERLEPKQRHLAFLVGLLVLTFVLTVMLAFRAHHSEMARQQQAQAMLQEFSAQTVREWTRRLTEFGSGAVIRSVLPTVHLLETDPETPLGAFAARAMPEFLCYECMESSSRHFFSLHMAGGTDVLGLTRLPEGLSAGVRLLIDARTAAPVSDSVAVGLLVYETDQGDAAGAVAALRMDATGSVYRAVGYLVEPPLLREYLKQAFDSLTLVPRSLSRGAPNDSFFSVQAGSRGLVVFSSHGGERFAAADTVTSGPLAGLTLEIGIRQNASTQLLLEGAATSGVPLLLALLFAICGLILLALILVRREAELVRLRADFISGVSHELRTPLAQIRMFTETLLLNRVRSDVERRRSLEIIDQEARRLTHLVENVLLFSKSEGGRRQRLAPEPTDLAAEVRRATESFGPMCRTRDVELRTELQEGITVAVDRGALRQIMVNLMDNALKYGPAGQRVTVGVALFDDQVRVWVDDQGPGIPEADRERVFDSFCRLTRDVEARTSGSGIGLAVVRELTRLHGGAAWVADAPGGGARIVVQFPDAYLRAEPAADLAAAS